MTDTQPVASFTLAAAAIDPEALKARLAHPAAGALATFEGWVRNHADGRGVRLLEYQVYPELAQAEGERVVAEAQRRFDVIAAHCVRAAAFDACRYIIDEVKQRLPIWKRETYAEGDSGWVNCQVVAPSAANEVTHG